VSASLVLEPGIGPLERLVTDVADRLPELAAVLVPLVSVTISLSPASCVFIGAKRTLDDIWWRGVGGDGYCGYSWRYCSVAVVAS